METTELWFGLRKMPSNQRPRLTFQPPIPVGRLTDCQLSQRIQPEFEPAVMELYLTQLDPRKIYFHQSDVEDLQEQAKALHRQLRHSDFSLMDSTLRIYQQRMRQSTAMALKLLESDFDFTVDESIDLNYRARPYCDSDDAIRDRWRKATKYELLAGRWPGESRRQQIERMRRRYRRVQTQVAEANREENVEVFLNAVAQTFDPHSCYLSATTVDSFNR